MNGGQERRHRREFEPPPWERDAFERFHREREDEEKEAELERALAGIHSEQPTVAETTEVADEVNSAGAGDVVSESSVAPREYPVPTAQMEELMAGLREEEPRAGVQYHGIANGVTGFLVVGGVGFVVWSGVLLGRAGPDAGALQMMASLLVMVWGFMMIGFGIVLWRKYNV